MSDTTSITKKATQSRPVTRSMTSRVKKLPYAAVKSALLEDDVFVLLNPEICQEELDMFVKRDPDFIEHYKRHLVAMNLLAFIVTKPEEYALAYLEQSGPNCHAVFIDSWTIMSFDDGVNEAKPRERHIMVPRHLSVRFNVHLNDPKMSGPGTGMITSGSVSALFCAIYLSKPLVVEALLKHPDLDPDARCDHNNHPLFACLLKNNLELFKLVQPRCKEKNPILSLPNDKDDTPDITLLDVIKKRDRQIVCDYDGFLAAMNEAGFV